MKPAKFVRKGNEFLIFSNILSHKKIALDVFGSDAVIQSAGFMHLAPSPTHIIVECFGNSESLHKKSYPQDSNDLDVALNINYNEQNAFAKYVIAGGYIVVFSHHVSHEQVLKNAFSSQALVQGAGYVRFTSTDEDVFAHCFGEAREINAFSSVQNSDYITKALY